MPQKSIIAELQSVQPSPSQGFNLRVAMLTYSFYESDNRVRRYAESLVRAGCIVDVISLRRQGQDKRNELNGVRIYRVQERVKNEKSKYEYLYRILKFFIRSAALLTKNHIKQPYDLVHSHSLPDFEVFAALIAKLTGSKIILDIHDIVPEFYANKFHIDWGSSAFKSLIFVEKISAKFSDHVIISNHLWKGTLCSRSVCNEKCTAFLNYPDERLFSKSFDKKPNGKFIFLYPGTLNFHQGLDLAVRAFIKIKDMAPSSELHIIGDGPAKNQLEAMARNGGVQNRVLLKDPMPLDDIAYVMANADVGIVPKRNNDFGGEAFSTKTLEFMCLGVPLLVAATKVDRYYFNDSVVRFFEPGNVDDLATKMLEMISNPEKRQKMADNALEFVEPYKWTNKEHYYLHLVKELIN